MPLIDMEMCACGKPLHYIDRQTRFYVEEQISLNGPLVPVTVEGRTWKVPRHYIALHGLVAAELPELAAKYKFEEVKK